MKRILGKVTRNIANENGIPEYANKMIVLYDNDRRHCEKRHLKDFPNKQAFHYVMNNLELIVEEPDEVFYVKSKDTLEYYKYFEDLGVTIRVRVEPGRELKMKTMFIAKETTIKGRIKYSDYNKYVIRTE